MNFTHLVGNTPMIRIRYKLDGREGFVWAKLEAYNLSGSIKDRLAAHVITKSTANGTLKPGQRGDDQRKHRHRLLRTGHVHRPSRPHLYAGLGQ